MRLITEDYFLNLVNQKHKEKGYLEPDAKQVYSFLDGELHHQRSITRLLLLFSRSELISHLYRKRSMMSRLYSEITKDIQGTIDLRVRYSPKKHVSVNVNLQHPLLEPDGILLIVYRLIYLEIGDDIPVYVNNLYQFKRARHRQLRENVIKTSWKYIKDNIHRFWR